LMLPYLLGLVFTQSLDGADPASQVLSFARY